MANTQQPAVSLSTLLLVAFIVLKLCRVIDWSWWWVLAPAWVPIAVTLVFLGLALPLMFAFAVIGNIGKHRPK